MNLQKCSLSTTYFFPHFPAFFFLYFYSKCHYGVCSLKGTVLSALHMLTQLMLIKYLQGNHHYAYLTDDTTLNDAERTHGKKAQNLT